MNNQNQDIFHSKALSISDFNNTQALCMSLMEAPHYAKMTKEGIFAIVETAKSLGVDPRLALGGGLYYVKGKVEMSARLMNSLIRSKKHSVQRDSQSDDKICILHGKRADNGDEWTESFSWDEAARAKLTNNPVWSQYPRDMLFARALSRLARQLFPDIIGNTYIEGEISLNPHIEANKVDDIPEKVTPMPLKTLPDPTITVEDPTALISQEQVQAVIRLFEKKYPDTAERNKMIASCCKKYEIQHLGEMTQQNYEVAIARMKEVKREKMA